MLEFFERYRNPSALAAAVAVQLILLGYQVRGGDDVTLLRSWTVGAVMPLEKGLHAGFDSISSLWENYVWLIGAREQSVRMESEVERLRLENQSLRSDLSRFARRQKLVDYRSQLLSETIHAEVIGVGASRDSKDIFIDRGVEDGVRAGMAVLTAEGVVGKVRNAFGRAALVMLINDVDAGVGVILGGSRVRGVMKGRGGRDCLLDYIAGEVKVSVGETVYTSGDDRIYPKGLLVGQVVKAEPGSDFQLIRVRPFAPLDRLDEVLVISSGVHQRLPLRPRPQLPETLLPLPPEDLSAAPDPDSAASFATRASGSAATLRTDADRVKQRYRDIAAAQGVRIGEAKLGDPPPDFNLGMFGPSRGPASAGMEGSEAAADEQRRP